MTLAMVFPGQGSQSQGMLADLAAQHQQVTDTYAEASDILGYDLSFQRQHPWKREFHPDRILLHGADPGHHSFPESRILA